MFDFPGTEGKKGILRDSSLQLRCLRISGNGERRHGEHRAEALVRELGKTLKMVLGQRKEPQNVPLSVFVDS